MLLLVVTSSVLENRSQGEECRERADREEPEHNNILCEVFDINEECRPTLLLQFARTVSISACFQCRGDAYGLRLPL